MYGDFEWDDEKAEANEAKHGVRFEEAALAEVLRWQLRALRGHVHPSRSASARSAFITDFIASGAPVSGLVENRFNDRWGRTLTYRSVLARISLDGNAQCSS